MEATTQFGRSIASDYPLMSTHKSPFPAYNVTRRSEAVATDQVYSDTPAVCGGETTAQLFVGRKSIVSDILACQERTHWTQYFSEKWNMNGAD